MIEVDIATFKNVFFFFGGGGGAFLKKGSVSTNLVDIEPQLTKNSIYAKLFC